MPVRTTIAITAYQGVLADEAESFRTVLTRIPGARVLTVGESCGVVAGPGGVQLVDATFGDVTAPDVVAVPGGLGCHRNAALAAWLTTVRPSWLLASSTGSALLAAAGLLHDLPAATHWLAGPILERHGAVPSTDRVVVAGNIVTCTGTTSAVEAALEVAARVGGADVAGSIVAELAALREIAARPPAATSRRHRRAHRASPEPTAPGRPVGRTSGPMVMVELEDVATPRRRR